MKLQKPRPERWPLTAARASNAASKRKADGLSQASASNAANFGLHRCSLRGTFLQLLAMKLLRPVPQLWPQASASNAANFGLHRCSLQAGNVTFKLQRSASVSDEIAAALA